MPDAFMKKPNERRHLTENAELFADLLSPAELFDWSEEHYCENLLRNRMMNELFRETVPVFLAAEDRNAMRVSVENRSPFLDRKLTEVMASVKNELLITDGMAKSILRDAVEGLVPNAVRLDPQKRGFNASIDSLLDRQNPETRSRLLDNGPVFDIVDRCKLEQLLESDMSSNAYSKFMFGFISTKAFLEYQQGWRPDRSAVHN